MLCVSFNAFELGAQDNTNIPPLTIQQDQGPIENVLRSIQDQTGYNFSFNSKLIDTEQDIGFHIENASLNQVLEQFCEQLGIDFTLIDEQIVLHPLVPGSIDPEQKIMLSGFISSKSSGESLISATIAVKGTSKGTISNEFGYYSMGLSPGKYELEYSYLGFQDAIVELVMEHDNRLDIQLEDASIELPAVVVSIPLDDVLNKQQLGEMDVPVDMVTSLPEFAGETGLINTLQTLPGVKSHSDGSSFFYARGGDRDQNLIIIDDAPIYNPSHFLGFYSLLIPDFVKSIQVHKSDMPASLGDRLSSIVNIRTKDGNLNKWQLSGALNPLINRISVEAPIVKKRSSIFASFRRSNFEWLYRINQTDDNNTDFHFQDFHFKWNYKINKNNRVFLTLISSGDFFINNDSKDFQGIKWGNFGATLRWNHIFNPKLFSNTVLYTGNYAYNANIPPNIWEAYLGMISLKTDFTHFGSSNLTSRFGFETQAYFNTPGRASFQSDINIFPNISQNHSRKLVLYYQGEYRFSDRIKLNAGFRMTSWANSGPKTYYTFDDQYEVSDTIEAGTGDYHNYASLDPRFSLEYKLDKMSQLKLAFGTYHQYLQLILNSISPFTSFEVWLPASPNILPQSSWQLDLGYLKYFQDARAELSASLYYKKLNNQVEYEPHAVTFINPLVEGELRFGEARSYGFELFAKKDFGRLNARLAYTYSRIHKTTEGINGGLEYRAFQDRPHDLSLVLNYKMGKRIFWSFNWITQSGSTYSTPTGFHNFQGTSIPIYGERNNDRLPAYHRMDFSVKFVLNKSSASRYKHSLIFSLYNAFGHENVYALKFNKIKSGDFSPEVPANVLQKHILSPSQADLIRFFPSLSYHFKI